MTNKSPAEIVVILDKSGSMQSIRKDTIGSFNRFLADQKELSKDTNISIITFSYEADTLYSGPVSEARELNEETYAPTGGTALNDAIMQGLMYLRVKNPKAAVMCIITDGEENSSKYSQNVKAMITQSESKNGWKFVYLGANVDAFKVGTNMGLSGVNTFNFAQTAQGISGASYAATASVQSYLSDRGYSNATSAQNASFKSLLSENNATTNKTIK
jgi:Mg-chelatase subunit ChlD